MDWNLFYKLAKNTAKKIKDSGYRPDFIVGLARGGWCLSRVLCDFLGVKDLVSLKVEHWGITATPNGKAQLKYPFDIDLTNRQVLIVDDITDTGQSMKVAIEYVSTKNPKKIRTATLRHIESSEFVPDYFGDKISWRWVIFPWNYVEDMCNLISKITEHTKEASYIKNKLKKQFTVNVSKESIVEILKEIESRKSSE
jgi:hypoxanthine phosphoribosyltransferase